jgi:hypothetical protein
MGENGIMISGTENIENVRLLALRTALRLQVKGFKNSGRSPLTITNELLGTKHRTSKAAYHALNEHIVGLLGDGFYRAL